MLRYKKFTDHYTGAGPLTGVLDYNLRYGYQQTENKIPRLQLVMIALTAILTAGGKIIAITETETSTGIYYDAD